MKTLKTKKKIGSHTHGKWLTTLEGGTENNMMTKGKESAIVPVKQNKKEKLKKGKPEPKG